MKPIILIYGTEVVLLSNPYPARLEPWEIKRGFEAFKDAHPDLTQDWVRDGNEYVAKRMIVPFPVRPEPHTLETDRVWADAIDQRANLEGDLWREYADKHPKPERLERPFAAYVEILCRDFGFFRWDREDFEVAHL